MQVIQIVMFAFVLALKKWWPLNSRRITAPDGFKSMSLGLTKPSSSVCYLSAMLAPRPMHRLRSHS